MIKTTDGKEIKKGEYYSRTDLGVKFPLSLSGKAEVNNEELLFITINNKEKFQNELHHDGVVHHAVEKLMDYDKKNFENDKPMHVFIRYFDDGSFLYLGKLEYAFRYDIGRNKLIIEGNHNVDKECVTAQK
jgi:hypothetical protein